MSLTSLNISKRIIELRKSVGWSQSELARQSGVTSAAISIIEKGKRNATLEVLKKLSKSLNVSLTDLAIEIPKDINKEKYDEDVLFCREFSVLKKLNSSDKEIVKNLANRLFKDYFGIES